MARPPWPTRWLQRSLEAALVALLTVLGTLAAFRLSAGSERVALGAGVVAAYLLAPAVLALAVIPSAYPVAMAATRREALAGSLLAFFLAAEGAAWLSPLAVVLPHGAAMAAGSLGALLAAPPALVGLLVGQLATPLGFGRRAGAWTAAVAAGAAAVILLAVAFLV